MSDAGRKHPSLAAPRPCHNAGESQGRLDCRELLRAEALEEAGEGGRVRGWCGGAVVPMRLHCCRRPLVPLE
jgi:hypothetical protein